jgi:hypothetical protein
MSTTASVQSLIDVMVQLLKGGGDDPTTSSRSGGDHDFPRFQVLRDRAGDGGLGSFPTCDVVDGTGGESESVGLAGGRKVVHLVVQDDPVRCHYEVRNEYRSAG